MPARARRFALCLALPALALGLASCSSNNDGKIAGQWEAASGPLVDQFKSSLPKADDPKARVSALLEFKADGSFGMGFRLANLFVPLMNGKYTLGAGNMVTLHDLKVRQAAGDLAKQGDLAVKVEVDGDTLTFTDSAGGTTFRRLTPPPLDTPMNVKK